ncbi:hypothetical protein D915_009960 [Fasciola hepatica]|uniref:Uncharacterized protein n=1 Tax=Fasciola hepatica TaxID=6192 RepID=A0A4E0QUU2_FASHE|nr:hypothetical protein D915_009960 [Fasciola hepatica]
MNKRRTIQKMTYRPKLPFLVLNPPVRIIAIISQIVELLFRPLQLCLSPRRNRLQASRLLTRIPPHTWSRSLPVRTLIRWIDTTRYIHPILIHILVSHYISNSI